jgi:hypothetical protein
MEFIILLKPNLLYFFVAISNLPSLSSQHNINILKHGKNIICPDIVK